MAQTAVTSTKKKHWKRHVRLAIRKRWVQLIMVLVVSLLVMLGTFFILKPKPIPKGDNSQYRFLICNVCNLEMAFNAESANKRCPKCQPPTVGYLMPAKDSVRSGGGGLDPWRWVYSGLFVETIVFLGVIVFLLYLPVSDPTKTFYVVACPHCAQKLRFRAVSLGGIGSCVRCKRMIRFPEEEDALPEDLFLKAGVQAGYSEPDTAHEE